MTTTHKSVLSARGIVAALVGIAVLVGLMPATALAQSGGATISSKLVGTLENGKQQGIGGVTFKLVDGSEGPAKFPSANANAIKTATTADGSGEVKFTGVGHGKYWVVPDTSTFPEGYQALKGLGVASFDGKRFQELRGGDAYGYWVDITQDRNYDVPMNNQAGFGGDPLNPDHDAGSAYNSSSDFIPAVADNPQLTADACGPLDVTLMADLSFSTADRFNYLNDGGDPTQVFLDYLGGSLLSYLGVPPGTDVSIDSLTNDPVGTITKLATSGINIGDAIAKGQALAPILGKAAGGDTQGALADFNKLTDGHSQMAAWEVAMNEGKDEYRKGLVDFASNFESDNDKVKGISLDLMTFATHSPAFKEAAPTGKFNIGGGQSDLQKFKDHVYSNKFRATNVGQFQQHTNWEEAFNAIPRGDGGDNASKLVIFLTDGLATLDAESSDLNKDFTAEGGPNAQPGWSKPRNTERGIAAANALKKSGVRVVAAGIGDAVQGDFAAANLAGISGYEEGNDYYQSNWSELGGVLADAINKSCDPGTPTTPEEPKPEPKNGVNVVKKINGEDANSLNEAATVDASASDIKITYEVSNNGESGLTNLSLADKLGTSEVSDNGFNIDESELSKLVESAKSNDGRLASKFYLGAGESTTFEVTVPVKDLKKGAAHGDTATITGEPVQPGEGDSYDPNNPDTVPPADPNGTPVNDDDPAHGKVKDPGTPANPDGGFNFTKTSDPESGSEVKPDQEITYTLEGKAEGKDYPKVTITDDLSKVLVADDAKVTQQPVVTIDGKEQDSAPTIEGNNLTWEGSLKKGQTVKIVYKVNVGKVNGQKLENAANAKACDAEDNCEEIPGKTEHPTPGAPGYEMTKTSDPESGTERRAGEDITYTVSGHNTGSTRLKAEINDDLSKVLNHAHVTAEPKATVDGEEAGEVELDGDKMTWTGFLEPGQKVDIVYTVQINEGVVNVKVNNHASSEAVPVDEDGNPTGDPITPPDVETEHPVPGGPGYELTKTSDPESGTERHAGEDITYTVSGHNTGSTRLKANINDDLSKVLNNAHVIAEPKATIGGKDAGEAKIDGDKLEWTGFLEPGEQVDITYTVKVNDGVSGVLINNHASSEAVPVDEDGNPTGDPINPPDAETEHPVPGEPGYKLDKVADPESGSNVNAGDTVTYTVTGTNTGGTNLDTEIHDDLSNVLNHAAYNNDAVATIDGEEVGEVEFDGTKLNWNGPIGIGKKVEIVYSVKVNDGVSNVEIHNLAGSTAQPTDPDGNPIGDPITPDDVETVHYVPGGFLASTGANVWAIAGVAAVIMLAGLGLVAFRRRA